MGAGAKGESGSKAGSPVEPSERIMRTHYSLFQLLTATEGRPAGKVSTEFLAFSLAGAGLDRTKWAIQG
jgi:hypothetical protein